MNNNFYFLYSSDETTTFLKVFQDNFEKNFCLIEPTQESVNQCINFLSKIPNNQTIVFLGHGHSTGLYTPQSENFEKYIFINSEIGNQYFNNKNLILLSCNSNQFISRLKEFNNIIGFGNILSSMEEISTEAENSTGVYRDVNQEDIDNFNMCYCYALIKAIKLTMKNKYKFEDIPRLIEFYLNQNISNILNDKNKKNRTEVAKLYYEFRNEMIYKNKLY